MFYKVVQADSIPKQTKLAEDLQYIVVQAESPADLQKKVNELIANNWQPQGGASLSLVLGRILYIQAMIRAKPWGK